MSPAQRKILLMFPITLGINLIIFWLFSEDRNCVFDLGSRCSNRFLLQCLFQAIILTLLFYFSNAEKGKK